MPQENFHFEIEYQNDLTLVVSTIMTAIQAQHNIIEQTSQ